MNAPSKFSQSYIDADPYPWPYNGDLRPDNTALIVIDMQTDFCGPGGYVDHMGYDLSLVRAPVEPITRVLATMRAKGYHIIHTREGHRPDLADLPGTNAGAPAASRQVSATQGLVAASSRAVRRAGTSSRNSTRSPASRSSTSPARAPSTLPTLRCC